MAEPKLRSLYAIARDLETALRANDDAPSPELRGHLSDLMAELHRAAIRLGSKPRKRTARDGGTDG